MGHLGVSTVYSRQRNLQIIKDRYSKNPATTIQQVNFLRRFPAFGHKKGLQWPDCRCLACEALDMLGYHPHTYRRYNRDYLGEIAKNLKQW